MSIHCGPKPEQSEGADAPDQSLVRDIADYIEGQTEVGSVGAFRMAHWIVDRVAEQGHEQGCPVCKARRFAKAAAQSKWRHKAKGRR